jgi:PGM1 C-terminal domain
MSFGNEERTTIVVLPSITFPVVELEKIIGIQHYEERLLSTVLMLRDSDLELVYATSASIDQSIIDYYLGFLSDDHSARRRLHLVALEDSTPRPLSAKLLERPDMLTYVRGLLEGRPGSYLLPFNVTPLETRVAEWIGVPVYGPHHDLIPLGSKSGSRHVARAAGVPVLEGAEDLRSVDEVESAAIDVLARRPDAQAIVVKLNNGFSGQGNAVIDRADVKRPLVDAPVTFCASEESWASFGPKIEQEGGVVEEFLRRPGIVSPSVQLRITPQGSLDILSTHDQVLGGPDDQVYLGCRFPARSAYRSTIVEHARRTGEELLHRGVVGPFGMDFILVGARSGSGPTPDCYLSEINLRMGGTSHPFQMASLVTGATYDAATGELVADGRTKCYVATDNLKSERYVGSSPKEAIAAIDAAGLGYDTGSRTGALLHLLGALERFGKVGVTCIANCPEEADDLFGSVVAALEGLGRLQGS